ncbi:E3 SUMO-protein ligase ZBED1-like [Saccostrea cucullata]|uniref:E3 SUMO-protein ligase ZBED1-like n=1 Tax=Saccostrea cuccullata TaxID=36930 RepID=UPI002ED18B98
MTWKKKLKKDVSTSSFVSITHDCWTSLNTQSFFTTTVHYINHEWNLKSAVLGTIQLKGSHTAQNISEELKATHTKWNLPPNPIATTDNAANEQKAFELLNWDRFGCYGHRLNLVVKHSLDIPEVGRLLGKGRKLVTFFHQSSSSTDLFHEKQKLLFDGQTTKNLIGHKLINDVPTRWNSTLYMLQRLVEQFPVMMALANDPALSKQASSTFKNCVFSFEEQSTAENIVSLLQPFEKATTIVCADKTPTMHKILPIIIKLLKIIDRKEDDEPIIRKMKEKKNTELNKTAVFDKTTLMGSVMNPFTKDLDFAPELREQAYRYLQEEAHEVSKTGIPLKIKMEKNEGEFETLAEPPLPALPMLQSEPEEIESESQTDEPQIKKLKSADTEDWLADIVCTRESQPNPELALENEIQRYLGCKILEKDQGLTVLKWWQSHEQFYPRLMNTAKKYLCVPASSVSSERVFSLCGNIVKKKRCRLSTNNIDMLVFLNRNIEYW